MMSLNFTSVTGELESLNIYKYEDEYLFFPDTHETLLKT